LKFLKSRPLIEELYLKSTILGEEPQFEKVRASKSQIIKNFSKEFNLPAKIACAFKNDGHIILKTEDAEVKIEFVSQLPPGTEAK
jgi:hypothetical protein